MNLNKEKLKFKDEIKQIFLTFKTERWILSFGRISKNSKPDE